MTTNTPSPSEHVILTEFDGSEGILVDLNSKRYYQLNETAMFIWKALEQKTTKEEMINDLTVHYEVSSEQAARSIEKLLQNLRLHKLVQP